MVDARAYRLIDFSGSRFKRMVPLSEPMTTALVVEAGCYAVNSGGANYQAIRSREVMMLVKVNATLVDPNAVTSLEGLTAELFDKDPLSVNLLAKGTVAPPGRVEFVFDITKTSDLDSLGELYPDLFVTVRDTDGNLRFRSRTIPDVRFLDSDAATGTPLTTVDLDFQRE